MNSPQKEAFFFSFKAESWCHQKVCWKVTALKVTATPEVPIYFPSITIGVHLESTAVVTFVIGFHFSRLTIKTGCWGHSLHVSWCLLCISCSHISAVFMPDLVFIFISHMCRVAGACLVLLWLRFNLLSLWDCLWSLLYDHSDWEWLLWLHLFQSL